MSELTVTVRPAAKEELTALLTLEADREVDRFIIAYPLSQHYEEWASEAFVQLVILADTEPCGYFILHYDTSGSSSIEFRRVVVGRRGLGIGQKAIRAMETYCAVVLRVKRIWLDVFEDNARGIHIYEKLGYRRFSEARHEGRALYLYEKQLRESLL